MINRIRLWAALLGILTITVANHASGSSQIEAKRGESHNATKAVDYVMNGHGTLKLSNGRTYVGDLRDGKPNGQGAMTYPDGQKYVGEFRDGLRHGQAVVTFADGRKFVGEYRDDKRNGQGVLTLSNGEKYVGEYRDGEKNGQGTSYLANGKVQSSGSWVNGGFVGESSASPSEPRSTLVESPEVFIRIVYEVGDSLPLEKVFDPSLAALIRKDNAISERLQSKSLVGDGLFSCTDGDKPRIHTSVTMGDPDHASATVAWQCDNGNNSTLLKLTRVSDKWRISDYAYVYNPTMSGEARKPDAVFDLREALEYSTTHNGNMLPR